MPTRRFWETKLKIIALLSKGVKTPGDVSRELKLAPSTVSQHLHELESAGAISRVDNPYVKKWKYYRASPSVAGSAMVAQRAAIARPLPYLETNASLYSTR